MFFWLILEKVNQLIGFKLNIIKVLIFMIMINLKINLMFIKSIMIN